MSYVSITRRRSCRDYC